MDFKGLGTVLAVYGVAIFAAGVTVALLLVWIF